MQSAAVLIVAAAYGDKCGYRQDLPPHISPPSPYLARSQHVHAVCHVFASAHIFNFTSEFELSHRTRPLRTQHHQHLRFCLLGRASRLLRLGQCLQCRRQLHTKFWLACLGCDMSRVVSVVVRLYGHQPGWLSCCLWHAEAPLNHTEKSKPALRHCPE